MYLIIDRQYRIYRTWTITGYLRNRARRGLLSIVNLRNMTGYNRDWTTSPVQDLPENFRVEEEDELERWPTPEIEQFENNRK